jgi:hypothetical protein
MGNDMKKKIILLSKANELCGFEGGHNIHKKIWTVPFSLEGD